MGGHPGCSGLSNAGVPELGPLPNPSTSVNMAAMTDVCCDPTEPPLGGEAASNLSSTLKAIADPARLRILSVLGSRGEVCVCDLTDPLDLSQPTVSHHMRVLHDAGIVERERRGKWVYYRTVPGALDEVAKALTATSSATTSA